MSSQRIVALVGSAVLLALSSSSSAAPPLSGAIFTTTVDGSIVNENVRYEAKEDVYLDGGPGPNAPASAAGLPAGDYYFQVTDPSGKDLLSTDHISCRKIHVNDAGVIDMVYPGTNYEKVQGKWTGIPCQHVQGIDIDHSELGAITVQLFPYDDTPNPGGVYKVWITPIGNYAPLAPSAEQCVGENGQCNVNGEHWEAPNFHGFYPAASKTDNYKVEQKGKPFEPPALTVIKFHDANMNTVQDDGEESIIGWGIDITDTLDVESLYHTPVSITTAEAGDYTIVEATPSGTIQTVSMLDGSSLSTYPTAKATVIVTVAGDSGETHEVIYGNVAIGDITACKYFDNNANGKIDEGEEQLIEGWKFRLTGLPVVGDPVGPKDQLTGADGCTTFAGLLPGDYTVEEILPASGWYTNDAVKKDVKITSTLDGSSLVAKIEGSSDFTNYCVADGVDFGTKGYWHNKNGLDELTQGSIDYVNGLDPYDSPSSYFDAGDEPFDGLFANGDPVLAAFNNENLSVIAPEGSAKAEVSHFLIDANAGGDPREQLAQQLLAFIFNVRHRLDGGSLASIQLPDGSFVVAGDLIDEAIAVWAGGSSAEQTAMQELLNGFNESDNVSYIPGGPCAVSYYSEI